MTLRTYKIAEYKANLTDYIFQDLDDIDLTIDQVVEGTLETRYASKEGYDKNGNPRKS